MTHRGPFQLLPFCDSVIFKIYWSSRSRNLPGAYHFPLDLQSICVQQPVFSQPAVGVLLRNGFFFLKVFSAPVLLFCMFFWTLVFSPFGKYHS